MKNEKTVTWTTLTGSTMSVTLKIITSKSVNLDGHIVDVPCCDFDVTATVDGVVISSWTPSVNVPRQYRDQCSAYYSHEGTIYGVSADNLHRLLAAEEKVKNESPEWQAKIQKINTIAAERDTHGAGWCDSCGSYCFGDCDE